MNGAVTWQSQRHACASEQNLEYRVGCMIQWDKLHLIGFNTFES